MRNAPDGAKFDDAGDGGRVFKWTPTDAQQGSHVVIFVAEDSLDRSLVASQRLQITVSALSANPGGTENTESGSPESQQENQQGGQQSNQPVGLDPIPDQQVIVDERFRYRIRPLLAKNAPVMYLVNALERMTFDDNFDGTRTISWKPNASDIGTHEVSIVAMDPAYPDQPSTQLMKITVNRDAADPVSPATPSDNNEYTDHRPVIEPLGTQSVKPGGAVIFKVTPVDPDGTPATLLLDPWLNGMRFDDNGDGTRTFFWQTTEANRGSHTLTFTALDGNDPSLADTESVTVLVGTSESPPSNPDPVTPPASPSLPNSNALQIAPMQPVRVSVGQQLVQRVTPLIPQGEPVPALTIEAGPSGTDFIDNGDASRSFVWIPKSTDIGSQLVRFRALSSSTGASVFAELQIEVEGRTDGGNVVSPPITETNDSRIGIEEIANQVGRPREAIIFRVNPLHPGRPVPSLLLVNPPHGSELADNGDGTRSFRWTPNQEQVGSLQLAIKAIDVWDSSIQSTRIVELLIVDDQPGTTAIIDPGTSPSSPANRGEAAQFLARATFGATSSTIEDLLNKPYEQWINDQQNKSATSHREKLDGLLWDRGLYSIVSGDKQLERSQLRMDAFWDVVVNADDQLRQRVAFALSQIFVISDKDASLENRVRGFANYHDLLLKHAFGNFRELLTDISLNPMMGDFLSSRRNERPNPGLNIQPDENYARELMQLFTIGLDQLELNGTAKRDSSGRKLVAYNQDNVFNFARVFTGWNYGDASEMRTDNRTLDSEIVPMQAFEQYHDPDPKTLLNGEVISGGRLARDDMTLALDNLFRHSNVAPFISRQLIQRLVTSNPTPDYIERIAKVFNDNGAGSRGDLSAVVKAILLDPEALNGFRLDPFHFGKLKEPVIKIASIWRAFNARGRFNRFRYADPDRDFAQQPYSAPSVFNFYSPDYKPPGFVGERGFYSPESQILNESTVLLGANRLFDYAFEIPLGGDEQLANQHQISLDLSRYVGLADRPDALLESLNELLMGGQMSDGMRAVLKRLVEQTPLDDNGSKRVREAIYVIFVSPEFSVQR